MQLKDFSTPFLAIGLILLILAQFITAAVPNSAVWTDDQAREYQKAAAGLHDATYGVNHKHRPGEAHAHAVNEAALAQAREQFAQAKAKLELAQARRNYPKYLLLALGLLFSVGGLATYFTALANEDNRPTRR